VNLTPFLDPVFRHLRGSKGPGPLQHHRTAIQLQGNPRKSEWEDVFGGPRGTEPSSQPSYWTP